MHYGLFHESISNLERNPKLDLYRKKDIPVVLP